MPQKSWSYFTGLQVDVKEFVMTGTCGKKGLFHAYSKRDKARADDCLNEAGMLQHQSLNLSELTAGQIQRALMAKALITKPELMILDEPTAGIDAASSRHIIDMLARINKTDNITVIITKDLPSIKNHIDYILKVSADGSVKRA